jgi:hypothetical protein
MLRPPRKWSEVVKDWAPELSAKLGRPIDALLRDGLTADDFSIAKSVEVRDPEGTNATFKFAFAVVRPQERSAAVFSEHDGYLEFSLVDGSVVAEIHEDIIYRQE